METLIENGIWHEGHRSIWGGGRATTTIPVHFVPLSGSVSHRKNAIEMRLMRSIQMRLKIDLILWFVFRDFCIICFCLSWIGIKMVIVPRIFRLAAFYCIHHWLIHIAIEAILLSVALGVIAIIANNYSYAAMFLARFFFRFIFHSAETHTKSNCMHGGERGRKIRNKRDF